MPDSTKQFGDEADRRDFLRASGCFIVACAAFGLPSSLAGLPIRELTGNGPANEKRFPLPAGDSVNIDRQTQVILVRFQNSVHASLWRVRMNTRQ
jgi:hypothetical protein